MKTVFAAILAALALANPGTASADAADDAFMAQIVRAGYPEAAQPAYRQKWIDNGHGTCGLLRGGKSPGAIVDAVTRVGNGSRRDETFALVYVKAAATHFCPDQLPAVNRFLNTVN